MVPMVRERALDGEQRPIADLDDVRPSVADAGTPKHCGPPLHDGPYHGLRTSDTRASFPPNSLAFRYLLERGSLTQAGGARHPGAGGKRDDGRPVADLSDEEEP